MAFIDETSSCQDDQVYELHVNSEIIFDHKNELDVA